MTSIKTGKTQKCERKKLNFFYYKLSEKTKNDSDDKAMEKIKTNKNKNRELQHTTDNRQRVHRTDKGSDESVNMCSTRISSSKRRKKSTPCGYMVDGGGSGGKQKTRQYLTATTKT